MWVHSIKRECNAMCNVAACRSVSNPAWCRIFRVILCFSPLNLGTLFRCCVLLWGVGYQMRIKTLHVPIVSCIEAIMVGRDCWTTRHLVNYSRSSFNFTSLFPKVHFVLFWQVLYVFSIIYFIGSQIYLSDADVATRCETISSNLVFPFVSRSRISYFVLSGMCILEAVCISLISLTDNGFPPQCLIILCWIKDEFVIIRTAGVPLKW